MRYNANINQVKAVEWGLNVQQAYLFVFFYELPSWAESITKDGHTYYFASKNKAIKEMPLLTDKKDTMYRYYKQIQDKDLIKIIKVDGKDYVRLTDKAKGWNCKSDPSDKNPSNLGKLSDTTSDKNPTYNTYNKNNNTNNNRESDFFEKIETSIPDLNKSDGSKVKLSKGEIRDMQMHQKSKFESVEDAFNYVKWCIVQEPDYWSTLKGNWGYGHYDRRTVEKVMKEFATWCYGKEIPAKPPKMLLRMSSKFFSGIDNRTTNFINHE